MKSYLPFTAIVAGVALAANASVSRIAISPDGLVVVQTDGTTLPLRISSGTSVLVSNPDPLATPGPDEIPEAEGDPALASLVDGVLDQVNDDLIPPGGTADLLSELLANRVIETPDGRIDVRAYDRLTIADLLDLPPADGSGELGSLLAREDPADSTPVLDSTYTIPTYTIIDSVDVGGGLVVDRAVFDVPLTESLDAPAAFLSANVVPEPTAAVALMAFALAALRRR